MTDSPAALPADLGDALLCTARRAIAEELGTPAPLTCVLSPPSIEMLLDAPGASFVTLELDGRLRGCIGTLEACRPLRDDVAANAVNAAVRDPRFPPVTADELADISIEVSVLSVPTPVPVASRAEALAALRPGVDGVVLEDGPHRATFLPQVWDELAEPETFLAHLCRKASLPADHWSASTRIAVYSVEHAREGDAE